MAGKGINVAVSAKDRLAARHDLAWAISVGGIGVVFFAALLLFTWYFAATLFLIFAGMLLGVALNALTNMLGRVVFLGGATIAQQATALSGTIKSQLVNVKAFLERNGIDTSYLDFGSPGAASAASPTSETPGAAATHTLPSAGALASSGGA